jgi:hypothetical protein
LLREPDMETFIVRLYRGGPVAEQELAGTVERVGTGDRAGFSGKDQLLECLGVTEGHDDRERDPLDADEGDRKVGRKRV